MNSRLVLRFSDVAKILRGPSERKSGEPGEKAFWGPVHCGRGVLYCSQAFRAAACAADADRSEEAFLPFRGDGHFFRLREYR